MSHRHSIRSVNSYLSLRESRGFNQSGKVGSSPFTCNGISGIHCKLRNNDPLSPKEKLIKDLQLAQLIHVGRLTASNQAVLPSSLHYRNVQLLKTSALHTGGNYDNHVQLDGNSKQKLIWWSSKLSKQNERALVRPQPNIVVKSDASLMGRDTICQNTKNGRSLDGKRKGPAHKRVRAHSSGFSNSVFSVEIFFKKHVLLQSDKKVAIALINNMGEQNQIR